MVHCIEEVDFGIKFHDLEIVNILQHENKQVLQKGLDNVVEDTRALIKHKRFTI